MFEFMKSFPVLRYLHFMHPEILLSEALAAACNSEAPANAFHVGHFLREALAAAHNSEHPLLLLMSVTFLERPSLLPTTPSANSSPDYPLRAPAIAFYAGHFLREALTAAHNSERGYHCCPQLRVRILRLTAAHNSEAPAIAPHVGHFLREALTAAHNSECEFFAWISSTSTHYSHLTGQLFPAEKHKGKFQGAIADFP
ncbi:hypothetical protein GG344DRAFT_71332 [Lentinula edodes]|nr:hypothetical protein GG344DRAFT_71332 [Lentinula edodes]